MMSSNVTSSPSTSSCTPYQNASADTKKPNIDWIAAQIAWYRFVR